MLYFGYGSNMLTPRIRARVPSARPVTTARLDGYALCFHKRSRDGSGKCTVVPDEDSAVYGVVFEVAADDIDGLDEAEQQGRRYRRTDVPVHTASTALEAFTYVAEPAFVDEAYIPSEWYHALVLAGAREHSLPPAYVERIASVRTYPDPNRERRRTYRQLLEEAGYPLLDA